VLTLGNFGQYIRNTWYVLKYGTGEGWTSLGQSCEKYSPREEEYPTNYKEKEG
jgi:hypothetical protein